jgi:hypothetical protein
MAKSYINIDDEPKKNKSKNIEDSACRYDIGEHSLTLMALLFLTKNAHATYRLRLKVLEFLNNIDDNQYNENQEIVWRIKLARRIGSALLKNSALDIPSIERRVLEDTDWAEYYINFFEAYHNNSGHLAEGYVIENELSLENITYIDLYVSTRLRYSYLWKIREFLKEVVNRIESGDIGDVSKFNDRVMSVFERIVTNGRRTKALSAEESQDFTTGDSSFEAALRATHLIKNKPQAIIKTGCHYLNDMLGGGYEGSRVYVHFGRSG